MRNYDRKRLVRYGERERDSVACVVGVLVSHNENRTQPRPKYYMGWDMGEDKDYWVRTI